MNETFVHGGIGEEDKLRADWYGLLARLLSDAPDERTLHLLREFEGDETELGQAIETLAAAARVARVDSLRDEYFTLFVGVGQSELTPYGSYYLTGFLNEKPLARLRGDMARLGIARADGVALPEDHVAALCEMMSGLITGAFGRAASLAEQRQFYDSHIGCWAPRFFEDLERSKSAAFYMPVGTLGRLFMAIESQAFDMAA